MPTESGRADYLTDLLRNFRLSSRPGGDDADSNKHLAAPLATVSFSASVQNPEGELLAQDLSTTLTIGGAGEIFTTLRLSFDGDSNTRDRDQLSFNHASIISGQVSTVTQVEFKQAIGSQHYWSQLSSSGDCYQVSINYDPDAVAVSGLDSDTRPVRLLKHLKAANSIVVYIRGTPSCIENITETFTRLRKEREHDPLLKYHTYGVRRYGVGTLQASLIQKHHPSLKVYFEFHNKDHYLFTIAAATQFEHDLARLKAEKYAKRDHKIIIAEVEEGNKECSRVFLQAPSSEDSKIKPGDKIKVLFPGRHEWSEAWTVTVASFAPQINKNFIEGHMQRRSERKMAEDGRLVMAHDDYSILSLSLNSSR